MTPAAICDLPDEPARAPYAALTLRVNEVGLERPWVWIRKGWADLRRAPAYSLTYGAVFVVVSLLLISGLVIADLFFLVPLLIAWFFLVAPLLGIGLYQISRDLEAGRPMAFRRAWQALRHNEVQIWALALILVLVILVWMLAAILVFALFYTGLVPDWEDFLSIVFLSGDNNALVLVGTVVGWVIAALTFAITALSVPLLMDRLVDALTAMRTSVAAVRLNWPAMALWAVLIVLFVALGILTGCIGLVVAMPVVGHGTWHAYRDLVSAD